MTRVYIRQSIWMRLTLASQAGMQGLNSSSWEWGYPRALSEDGLAIVVPADQMSDPHYHVYSLDFSQLGQYTTISSVGQFDLIGEYEGQSWGTEGFRGFLDGTMDPIFSMNLDEGITSGINLSMEGTSGSTWIQNLNAENQYGYNFIDSRIRE